MGAEGRVLRGEVEPYWVMGGVIDVKLDAEATGGAFTMIEIVNPPGGGVPPHVHERDDETVAVLEGELSVLLGDAAETVGPGDTVFIPRGLVHAFTNTGNGEARALAITSPGGSETMLRDGAVAKTSDAPPPEALEPDIDALMTAATGAGLRFLPSDA